MAEAPITDLLNYVPAYGWKPSPPDFRDHIFEAADVVDLDALPDSVDLDPQMGPVLNQSSLGSCTANAVAECVEFCQIAEGVQDHWTPSRLFIYYNERAMEGSINQDSGAALRDGIKSVASQGAPPESAWPYDIKQFRQKPNDAAYKAAKQFRAVNYKAVQQSLDQMRGCLASGFPIAVGATLYQSFESQQVVKTGLVPMPGGAERRVGGHAFVVTGFDMATGRFKCRNSWGAGWGDRGNFSMPFQYLTNPRMASDFWRINVVTMTSTALI